VRLWFALLPLLFLVGGTSRGLEIRPPGGMLDLPVAYLVGPAVLDDQEGDDNLVSEEEKWGFWDSYPNFWLVPIGLLGYYVGIEQVKIQFDFNNKADEAERRGDTEVEQKYRNQALAHEVVAVLSLVGATICFSYGIKKREPDIFESVILDRRRDRVYLGYRGSFWGPSNRR